MFGSGKRVAMLVCALLLAAAGFLPMSGALLSVRAAAEAGAWATSEEAEAARAAAEEAARALAQEYARLSAEADKAEKAAKKAEGTAQAEARRKEAEEARAAADEANRLLMEAAMALKEATEASVRMAKTEAVDDSKISGSFRLGERYSGRFNQKMEPLYVRFRMERAAKVRMSTTDAKVSITVLDDTGNTILTLVPSSSGKGSVCSLQEGEYTFLISAMGAEEKRISVSVMEFVEEAELPGERKSSEDEEEETEMMTLVEFD